MGQGVARLTTPDLRCYRLLYFPREEETIECQADLREGVNYMTVWTWSLVIFMIIIACAEISPWRIIDVL